MLCRIFGLRFSKFGCVGLLDVVGDLSTEYHITTKTRASRVETSVLFRVALLVESYSCECSIAALEKGMRRGTELPLG
jgi:hypothetical protein